MTAVEFRQVSFSAGGQVVLDQLSLSVEAGETLVLLGRSGAGKTTALKMVNGLVFPSAGEVLVDGRSTTSWELIQLRRSIGYVIQEVGLFPHLTASENVGLVPRLKAGRPNGSPRAPENCWNRWTLLRSNSRTAIRASSPAASVNV